MKKRLEFLFVLLFLILGLCQGQNNIIVTPAGKMERAVSGHFAGIVDGQLTTWGGCNFPDVPCADGGQKVFYPKAYGASVAVPEGTDILINATPIGFTPAHMQRPDIDYDTIREGMVAADVVFDPVDTLFLEECGKHGARCFNGIGMLVQQGALNFTMWTGKEAPVDVMYDALAKEIQG